MNTILIKLLADWTDPAGEIHSKGSVLEFNGGDEKEKALAADLVLDGKGERTTPSKTADQKSAQIENIKSIVQDTVREVVKDLPGRAAKELHDIQVKDLSDEDPTWGYLAPRADNREHSEAEKAFGMWQFAEEVFQAAVKGSIPERLAKCGERRKNMLDRAVAKGFISKAASTTSMVAGQDPDGGYLIPPEFNLMLLAMQEGIAVVRPRATVIPIGSTSLNMPQWKDYDHSSNTIYGGVQAYFKSELATLTESKPVLEDVQLNLNALTALAYASHQMMTFSPQTASYLMQAMAEAVAWKEDDKFLDGTGAGMPLGIIGHAATTTIAIESGQTLAAAAVVTANIVKMFGQHKMRKRASTCWLYNKVDLFRWLATLSLDVGTGGSIAGLISRLPGSPQMDMLGIPLVDSEHCKAAGTVGDILLCDFSEYIVADHNRGADVARSMHLKFDAAQEAFRIIKYVDGQPRYSDEFTRQNSTNTSSPFVELAARS
jgi:HK97 family phage major capsid protein